MKAKKEVEVRRKNLYFAEDKDNIDFVSSGSTILDLVLGGGIALGRIFNIVGDSSSGKTLNMIEACANFTRQYPDGDIFYLETENAFDKEYAEALGIDTSKINFDFDVEVGKGKRESIDTVEKLFTHLEFISSTKKKLKKDFHTLYIVDSFDGLSDKAEREREIGDGSYGTKSKKVHELFRRAIEPILKQAKITLAIVSQERDKIGVMFGEKKTRSCYKPLNFWSSQILWLSEKKKITKQIKKQERVLGVEIIAKCKKNKVGMAYRTCEYSILFGYGINDILSCLEFLESVGELDQIGVEFKDIKTLSDEVNFGEYSGLAPHIRELTKKAWIDIEKSLLPKKSKYGN